MMNSYLGDVIAVLNVSYTDCAKPKTYMKKAETAKSAILRVSYEIIGHRAGIH